jgi:hypothetical protein
MTLEESTHLFRGEPLAQTDLGPDGMAYDASAIATPIIPAQFLAIETPYPTNVQQSQLIFGDQYSPSQSYHHQLDNQSYPPFIPWNTSSSQLQHLDHRNSTVRALESQTFTDFYLEDCARNPGDGDQ